jgi:hypothetical protein
MKIVFLCDFFLEDILGGGEICNECVIDNFKKKDKEVIKLKTKDTDLKTIANYKDNFFIIGNFTFLNKEIIDYITNNINYCIYEHDYKFASNRNPAKYVNFLLPKNEIIYYDFYKNAKKIICQTDFQKDIFEKNLNFSNIVSLGTNFWLDNHYQIFEELSSISKNNKTAIIDYAIQHKNTAGSIAFCKKNNLNFELIKDYNYENFLKKLGTYSNFVFLPQTPETFSRTVLEARMMNVDVYSNSLIGCTKEPWYKEYKGKDLISFTKEKNKQAYKFFEDLL